MRTSNAYGRKQAYPALLALFAASLVALLLLTTSARGQAQKAGGPDVNDEAGAGPHVADRLIVTYEDSAWEMAQDAVTRAADVRVREDFEQANLEVVQVPEAQAERAEAAAEEALETVKKELEGQPAVAAVDYDYVRSYFGPASNDPRYDSQYNLTQTGFNDAWRTERGDGVLLGVVDSGISQIHPDLQGKVALQYDFFNRDNRAEDNVGHGTAVSGIAAAVTDNGIGIAGACPACRLLVAKDGDEVPVDSASIRGIYWAVDHGADVINISSGSPQVSTAYERAVSYARNHGVLVVAAAGNEWRNRRTYPAAYPASVAVSAIDRTGTFATFSNRGSWVDLAAPGVGIQATVPGGEYQPVKGTSFSTPEITALAGLLSAQGLTDDEARTRMQGTATDLGPRGDDPLYGHGRINAAAAVR
ncbi:MAG TPA: S8 family serine peptidase [Rubrobacter sp.]|nr:S8 family serine peptidase [Rubrobacter sp.]